jgi:hypothetical protein
MIIHISEANQCWICGEEDNITSHHALPKHLKPKNNIIIPVCDICHKKLNAFDINGMYTYLYKIKKSIKENVGAVNIALGNLNELKELSAESVQIASEEAGE